MGDASKQIKKDGYAIYTTINNKICKCREDMKLMTPKINEMEKILSDLL